MNGKSVITLEFEENTDREIEMISAIWHVLGYFLETRQVKPEEARRALLYLLEREFDDE